MGFPTGRRLLRHTEAHCQLRVGQGALLSKGSWQGTFSNPFKTFVGCQSEAERPWCNGNPVPREEMQTKSLRPWTSGGKKGDLLCLYSCAARNGLAKEKNNSKSTSPHSSLFVWRVLVADTGFADVSAMKQLWLPEEKGPDLLYGDRDKLGQSPCTVLCRNTSRASGLYNRPQPAGSHLPSITSQSNTVDFRSLSCLAFLVPQLCHSLQQGQNEILNKSRISPSKALK